MLLVGFKADLFLSCMKSNAEHSGAFSASGAEGAYCCDLCTPSMGMN